MYHEMSPEMAGPLHAQPGLIDQEAVRYALFRPR